jgi:hypothetical protein
MMISFARRKFAMTAALALVSVGFFGATSAVAESTDEMPEDAIVGSVDQLTVDEAALLESDKLKRVKVDPFTGDITSVEPISRAQLNKEAAAESRASGQGGEDSGISTLSATWNLCSSAGTATCWYGRPPTLNVQFSSGKTTGTWGSRTKLWTGNYYAKACWLDPQPTSVIPETVCMPLRNGKNAWIEWGFVLTGKSMDVSTTR